MSHTIHVNSEEKLRQVFQAASQITTDGAFEVTIKKLPKTRTGKQNRALHAMFTEMASGLNSAGYSVQTTLTSAVDREWTPDAVKELLWRPIQLAITDKKSTTELERQELSEVYEVLNRHIGQKFGVHARLGDE